MVASWVRRAALLGAVLIIPACGGGSSGGGSGGGPTTPASPTGLAATPGNTQIALAWTVSAGATSYNVYRAGVSGGPYTNIANVAAANHTDPGLANGTPYFYVVTAVNAAGESGNSNEASALPLPPPPAPTGLVATPGNAQVGLTWNASATATGYNLYRGTVSGGPYTLVSPVAVTNHTDTGRTNGIQYFYVVRAVNAAGEGVSSGEASATPIGPPAAPTGLGATPGNTQVGLTWTASATATSYNVYRGTAAGGPYALAANVAATTHTDAGRTNGVTYYYVVRAVNASGEGAASSEVSAIPFPPPPAPTGLTPTWGNSQVDLTWNASAGAASYNVYRGTTTGGPYSLVVNVATTNYTNTGLTNTVPYFFVVRAANGAGESPNSAEVSGAPNTVPAAPTGLVATPGNAQVGLTWNAVGGTTGYRVERSLNPGGPYALLTTVGAPSHTDTPLTNGTTYRYVVRGVNGSVLGPASTEASATPTGSSSPFNHARGLDDITWAVAPAADGSGKVYAGGRLHSFGSQAASGVVRINSDGTLDTGFSTGTGIGTGYINAVLPLASGKVMIGGDFSVYNGTAVNDLLRLNADGTIDGTFVVGTGIVGWVNAIALAPDGSGDVYVGGTFTSYNGTAANHFVRLNSDGSIDGGFVAGTAFSAIGSFVASIAAATDGSNDVYVGGQFSLYNGTAVSNIVRLNNDGSRDAGFPATCGGQVNAVVVAADGSNDVFVGGLFGIFNGAAQSRIVRVNADGTTDGSFVPTGASFNTDVLGLLAAGTDVYVCGIFTFYGVAPVGRIARLNGDGSLDAGFAIGTGFNDRVTALASDGSGGLYAVGMFTGCNGVGVDRLTRLNATGTIVGMPLGSGFGGAPNNQVLDLAFVPSTTDVYVAGYFTHYDGIATGSLVRLNSDGTIDPTLAVGTGFQGPVLALALAADGDVYCAGGFTAYKAAPVSPLIRLNPDGTRDTAFAFTTGFNGNVNAIVLAPDGSGDVIVGGLFTQYNGTTVNRIARLNPTGGLVAFALGTAFSGSVNSLAIGPSNTIYVGGTFTQYNGTAKNFLVRLNLDGTIDAGFNQGTGLNGSGVNKLLADGADGVYVSGDFSTYNGATRWRLARVDSNGTLNAGFSPTGTGFNAAPLGLALGAGGDLYCGGPFSTFNGATVRPLLRLNSDGTLDAGFPATTTLAASAFIQALAVLPDASGRLYAGGTLTSWAGTTIDYFARFTATGAIE